MTLVGQVVLAAVALTCTGEVAAQQEALHQLPVKVNPYDGARYILIPPGSFNMGCSPGDSECRQDENPVHRVTITKGFWLAQTEVTQAAWVRVMGTNPSKFKGDNLPVESISAYEIG